VSDDGWAASWKDAEWTPLLIGLSMTPAQRLDLLEEMIGLARGSGAFDWLLTQKKVSFRSVFEAASESSSP